MKVVCISNGFLMLPLRIRTLTKFVPNNPLTRSGSSYEVEYMKSRVRLEAGEAMLFSIPVSWDVSRITDPNNKKRFSSGKLSPGKYKIGLQLEIYMNTVLEVK